MGKKISIGVGILVAAVVLALIARRGQPRDTAVAIVLTSFFSLGVVLVSATEGIAGSLSDFFFGRLLTITWGDLWIALVLIAVGVALVAATAATGWPWNSAFSRAITLRLIQRMS